MIQCANVSKVFQVSRPNGVAALKEITLCIDAEKTVVFRGPSGSGKTTLLSLLGCMSRPTTGRIWIKRVEVSTLSERLLTEVRRQYFGFLFQDFQLIHDLSGLDNVMLPLYPGSLSRRTMRIKAMALLSDLGLSELAEEPVERLSGGEQQRVALARALINDPECLVADEPTAHLDTALSRVFLDLIGRLKRQGKTVLMASHDPLVCEAPVTSRVITLRDGQLQEDSQSL